MSVDASLILVVLFSRARKGELIEEVEGDSLREKAPSNDEAFCFDEPLLPCGLLTDAASGVCERGRPRSDYIPMAKFELCVSDDDAAGQGVFACTLVNIF